MTNDLTMIEKVIDKLPPDHLLHLGYAVLSVVALGLGLLAYILLRGVVVKVGDKEITTGKKEFKL